jgi:hypothetical protein
MFPGEITGISGLSIGRWQTGRLRVYADRAGRRAIQGRDLWGALLVAVVEGSDDHEGEADGGCEG